VDQLAHEWAFVVADLFALEDDAGRPVVLTVAEPLHPASQRLMDYLAVEVRVVTATAQMTTCPVKLCTWTFVGSEEEAAPWLQAHLKLMHAGSHRNGSALGEAAAVGQSAVSGSADRISEPERAATSPSTRKKQWTREAIIAAIQRWHTEHGEPPISTQWQKKQNGSPTVPTVVAMFETWNAAIIAAGFTPRTRGAQQGNQSKGGRPRKVTPAPEERETLAVGADGSRSSDAADLDAVRAATLTAVNAMFDLLATVERALS
jgi:Homing endonuclease associated repeat